VHFTYLYPVVCTRLPILRFSCSNRLQVPRKIVKKVSSVGFWTNEEFGGSKRGIWLWKCGGNQIIWIGTMQGNTSRLRSTACGWAKYWGGRGTKKGMPVGDGKWLQAGGR